MGYGRRTQWKRRPCRELYCLRKRHFGKVWRATKSAQERESCDERLRFLRTRRSRTRWPTTKGVKAKEKVAQKVDSIFKKPHRADGELTLSEGKFEAENTAEKKEVSDENNQGRRWCSLRKWN